ncbi:MAG: Clp protease N-terminal domain-containing protein, partial [Bacteroidota bacterium]
MEAKFSPRVKDVITFSKEEALRLGHDCIGTEHLMLGMIREGEGVGIRMLKNLQIDIMELRKAIEHNITIHATKKVQSLANIPLAKQAERVLKMTYLEAKSMKSEQIGTEHLLLCILKDNESVATRTLSKLGVDEDSVRNELKTYLDHPTKMEGPSQSGDDDDDDTGGSFSGGGSGGGEKQKKQTDSKSKTPVLDNFGRDLTKMAEDGKLDPIVGREKEIERVSQILSRRKKNNPILIGEPGVGKSAIAEGLALRII